MIKFVEKINYDKYFEMEGVYYKIICRSYGMV
jgi:hypothetical protein